MSREKALSTAAAVVIMVVLVVAVGAGIYFITAGGARTTTSSTAVSSSTSTSSSTTASSPSSPSSSSTTAVSSSTSTSSSSSSTQKAPNTFTYEVAETPEYLDPGVSYYSYDYNIIQNVYEPLFWYNGTCSTCIIPWLAQGYVSAPNLMTYNVTLRSGITFADGETFNSTAVYFSLNRLLLLDGSTPVGHGTQASWLIQQLLNTSLSSTLSGAQTYGQRYLAEELAQDFVTVTGPLTVSFHVAHPSSAFTNLLAGEWSTMVAPEYVMQHDLAIWNASSAGYTLPYPKLSGGMTTMISEYFADLVSTCDSGSTPSGCGNTYLNTSNDGSLAGTGPYTISSNDVSKSIITLAARPGYWGGPYQFTGGSKIVPKIQSVVFKFVPDQTTREIDLQNAAKSGEAMAIDVAPTNLYDIADRTQWVNNNLLESSVPGVSMYGPYTIYTTLFDPFDTNVTDLHTGLFYKFQPFADLRFRMAFSDSVNMTQINVSVNNKIGQVAINVVPPGLPPTGSYNESITPAYSYNPDQVQALLLDAMMHPLTSFRFTNGTAAPPGLFNNTFGCATLNAQNQCDHPVPQTIPIYFGTGDTVDEQIMDQIAGTINNVSNTYNMGLTVTVVPIPTGQMLTEAFATPTHLYMYALGWIDDYPWVLDFIGPMYAPNQAYPGPDGWNLPIMGTLYQQAVNASETGNIPGILTASDQMNTIANREVMYLWTFYQANFITMTSNVQGLYFNPSLSTAAGGGVGPEYFATLY